MASCGCSRRQAVQHSPQPCPLCGLTLSRMAMPPSRLPPPRGVCGQRPCPVPTSRCACCAAVGRAARRAHSHGGCGAGRRRLWHPRPADQAVTGWVLPVLRLGPGNVHVQKCTAQHGCSSRCNQELRASIQRALQRADEMGAVHNGLSLKKMTQHVSPGVLLRILSRCHSPLSVCMSTLQAPPPHDARVCIDLLLSLKETIWNTSATFASKLADWMASRGSAS